MTDGSIDPIAGTRAELRHTVLTLVMWDYLRVTPSRPS